MVNYYIGIPSYKRVTGQETLKYLEKLGVPKEKIIMSVQNDEDLRAYQKAGLKRRVGALIKKDAHNAAGNRNTILDYLGRGKRVIILDDDIEYISKLYGKELRPIETLEEFEKLIYTGYRETAKNHTALWGVYPVHNAYFMGNRRRSRNIIEGTFLGIKITDMYFDESYDTKEDYEYGCRVIRNYGASVRLDNYACKAPHYSAGGCDEFWREKNTAMKTARTLVGKYPDILQMNPRRPGEVLMRRKRDNK